MKSCPRIEELSAYLDGESRDGERIARHLQSCPACARRHLELCRVSIHLKAIEPPETDAAFTGRVMATIEAESRSPASPRAFPPRLVMAASFLALIGAAVLPWMLQAEKGAGRAPGAAPAVNPEWRDDAAVVDALAGLMEAGADVALFSEWEEGSGDDVGSEVTIDEVVEALAEAVPEDSIEYADVPEDFAAIMDALAALDAGALEQLLQDYEREG